MWREIVVNPLLLNSGSPVDILSMSMQVDADLNVV
jgi:hypothetical protein